MHTNMFVNNRNLHKFAITNSNLKKKDYLDMHYHITYICTGISIFSKIGLVRRSLENRAHNLFAKKSQVV